jgi:hypothetical protein
MAKKNKLRTEFLTVGTRRIDLRTLTAAQLKEAARRYPFILDVPHDRRDDQPGPLPDGEGPQD